ncbi:ABC transporter-related protein [Chthoniobacter flavus Ellin428]|uniref:ABC transporter-related protein n=1 Tax=Chthoniobacter flavus Ellin428 TaxID=497964 RepID=B4D4K2_9BACT|nr:ABC transporter transmembrane domain-containing protein [Chthoniobacter flavus]EDY18455.1 ABC transporter-related protein [Chthoniobacter flavus Ellin428]
MANHSSSAEPRRKLSFHEITGLLHYVRPWRGRFALAMVALLVSMSFGLCFPLLIGRLIDSAMPTEAALRVTSWHPSINTVALLLAGTLAIQAVLTFFYSYTFNFVGENAVVRLRQQLYDTLLSLPMKFFGEHRVGELTSRLSNDLTLLTDTLAGTVPQALRQMMMLFGGVVAIVAISPRLSLVMVSTFPVLMLVAVFLGRKVRRVSREAQDRLAESATIIEETFQGIANVKAFTNERYEVQRYGVGLHAYLNATLRGVRRRASLVSFIILGIFGSITFVMWYGATLMQAGRLSHGQLTTFTLYTLFVGGAVSSFAEVFSQLQRVLGAQERVQELLGETGEPAAEAGALERFRGDVEFAGVGFSYPSRPDLPVLRDLSLAARAGEKIALVGPSGAGKSTIVSLLLRFYEPDIGRILIDGAEAHTLALGSVRGNMAIVPQEVLLFGGSIRDNIAYGRPQATEEEIFEASRRAHCHEFISRFPEGYGTLVGERGVKLSGGQRQRIAIARALLKDPAILILDEATSSLDSESEALIQEALAELLIGRTSFIIAHRLSTVRQCDRILRDRAGDHDRKAARTRS